MFIKLKLPTISELHLKEQEVICPILWSRDDELKRVWRFPAKAIEVNQDVEIKYLELVYLKEPQIYSLQAITEKDNKEHVCSAGPIKELNIKFEWISHFHLFL